MFQLNLVTPEKVILTETEIEEVIVPGFMGELNILPGHAPLMTTLDIGVLRYRLKGQSDYGRVVISWGYCEVNPQGITVLAETAESIDEINRERAERALRKSKEQLFEPDLSPDQIKKFQRKVQRAEARLAALK